MNHTWQSEEEAVLYHPQTPRDWLRVVRRGLPVALVTFGGLALLMLLRVFERPLCGPRRPVTPYLTRAVCRANLLLLGFRTEFRGKAAPSPVAIVANHSTWLDIFALNAAQTVVFVSKAEVASWPGIGLLAKATGTLFIKRETREVTGQVTLLQDKLRAGERLVFFPEGTSGDGRQVLPFKPALFAALTQSGLAGMQVQPVTLYYDAPAGRDRRFYGWWGNMDFGPHLLSVLSVPKQGRITVTRHAPLSCAAMPDRKALSAHSEATIRAALCAQIADEARP